MAAAENNKFFNLAKTLLRGRRWPTGGRLNLSSDSDLEQVVDSLKRLANRVEELEGNRPAPWTEFELDLPAGSNVTVEHGFGCPVRYTITHWVGAAAPSLSRQPSSTDNTLVLSSLVAGRATVRVEKSQYGLT